MVDMHSHILPAIDDGARDVNESIMMLEDSYEKRIRKVIATPHLKVYTDEELKSALEARDKAYADLMRAITVRGVNSPEIIKGFEVHLDKDITEFSRFETLCIEGTNAMLVEMPMSHWDKFALDRIEALKKKGIIPILAHIERYIGFKRNIKNALELEGVIYQVNANAFFGIRRKRLIKKLAKLNKKVIVGSDMHNMGERRSFLREAYIKVKRHKYYKEMFCKDIYDFC